MSEVIKIPALCLMKGPVCTGYDGPFHLTFLKSRRAKCALAHGSIQLHTLGIYTDIILILLGLGESFLTIVGYPKTALCNVSLEWKNIVREENYSTNQNDNVRLPGKFLIGYHIFKKQSRVSGGLLC
jgi:hypothetical protein